MLPTALQRFKLLSQNGGPGGVRTHDQGIMSPLL